MPLSKVKTSLIENCDLDVVLLTQISLRYKMRYPSFSLLTSDKRSNWEIQPKKRKRCLDSTFPVFA